MKDVSVVVGSFSLSLFIVIKGIFSPEGPGVDDWKRWMSSSSSSSSSSFSSSLRSLSGSVSDIFEFRNITLIN